MAKKLTLEESFDALDVIIGDLQGGELTLEESFQKYEAGMKLIKNCNDAIDKVEKKLAIINGSEENMRSISKPAKNADFTLHG